MVSKKVEPSEVVILNSLSGEASGDMELSLIHISEPTRPY